MPFSQWSDKAVFCLTTLDDGWVELAAAAGLNDSLCSKKQNKPPSHGKLTHKEQVYVAAHLPDICLRCRRRFSFFLSFFCTEK